MFIQLTYPTQLLADDFARNGFKVYAPDIVEGDPVPADAFNPVCHSSVTSLFSSSLIKRTLQGVNFDLASWIQRHSAQTAGAQARKVIEGLRAQGITIYGATGYCYGGMSTQHLAVLPPVRDAEIVSVSYSPHRYRPRFRQRYPGVRH